MFLDIHVLQTLPYSNLNRDDLGSPKTVVYGGATRARVSSQAWKRATRLHVEQLFDGARTYRTRNPDLRLTELLEKAGVPSEEATNMAAWVFNTLGTRTKDDKDNVILFVAESELLALSEVCLAHRDAIGEELAATPAKGKKSKPSESPLAKPLLACLTVPRPTSIAVFGRMLAAAPQVNVDASMQVAHAFSVNPVDVEIDYFTAAEDLPDAEDLTGGAHIGQAEFVAATFYRYATINFAELTSNIGGDDQLAAELARITASAFCLAMPTGKANVTAPHTVPDLVHVALRGDRPVSYAAAFEQPITSQRASGFAEPAVNRLIEHAARVRRMVPTAPVNHGVTSTFDVAGDGPLGSEAETLDRLIAGAIDHLRDGAR